MEGQHHGVHTSTALVRLPSSLCIVFSKVSSSFSKELYQLPPNQQRMRILLALCLWPHEVLSFRFSCSGGCVGYLIVILMCYLVTKLNYFSCIHMSPRYFFCKVHMQVFYVFYISIFSHWFSDILCIFCMSFLSDTYIYTHTHGKNFQLCHLQRRELLFPLFSISMPFISVCCLITPHRNSSKRFNMSSGRRCHWLFPDLKGKFSVIH